TINKEGNDGIFAATKEADYLIVTNPKKMLTSYMPNWKTNFEKILSSKRRFKNTAPEVLMLAGQLAAKKNGVLGYVDSANRDKLNNLLKYNWDISLKDSKKGHLDQDWNNKGFLLLIGETNIIPSFSATYEDKTATCVDNEYADIKGSDRKPELIVGRLIGNSAKNFVYQLEKSLNHKLGKTSAFCVSGGKKDDNKTWPWEDDKGNRSFRSNVNEISRWVKQIWKTEKKHLSDNEYDNDSERLQVYKDNIPNKDFVYYRNHGYGSKGTWTSFSMADVTEIDFGDKNPFICSISCRTGNYQGVGFGEKFLCDSKASIFFGSTENSLRSYNNSLSETLVHSMVLWPNRSIGEHIYQTKRAFPGLINSQWDKYTNDEYNLYGDPKIGFVDQIILPKIKNMMMAKSTLGVINDIDTIIPDYEVVSEEGIDYVSIPGGTKILKEDRPEIPVYKIKNDYPQGYKIQNIVMINKSGLQTQTGLNLPITDMRYGADSKESATHIKICGWYPEHEFLWNVNENPDGTTTLIITVFTFYYDECTTDVKFYKNL
ncbi:MAG: C25 family cysteine peptidase, partial [Deltaproteobacteria bacterium]|nr:C25 family cysteine peptidase [Deltaproteobacteria bacterium]